MFVHWSFTLSFLNLPVFLSIFILDLSFSEQFEGIEHQEYAICIERISNRSDLLHLTTVSLDRGFKIFL